MNGLNVGDKVTTLDAFPTIGIIHSFGYIPLDINPKVFLECESFKGSLVAVDLTWANIQKISD